MPFIDISPPEKTPAAAPQAGPGAGMAKEPVPVAPAPSATTAPTKPLTPQQQGILVFKQYLAANGMYRGDVQNPEADAEFVAALRKIENALTTALRKINPSAASLSGVIWVGDRVNPNTSPEDIDKSLKLIQQHVQMKKESQATVDTFDVEEYQSDPPMAFKPNPTGEDQKLETGDPVETQQTGALQPQIPTNFSEKAPTLDNNQTMDSRILGLSKLLLQLSR